MSGLGSSRMAENEANARRVENARRTVEEYLSDGSDGQREAVVDAITDLMHFCLAEDLDFTQCVRISRQHFEAER